jgi:hypothetical protein
MENHNSILLIVKLVNACNFYLIRKLEHLHITTGVYKIAAD